MGKFARARILWPRLICGLTSALLLTLTVSCAGTSGTADTSANAEKKSVDFFAMNTYMTITAYGPGAADAVAAGEARVYAIENEFSRTIADSPIKKIEENAGVSPVVVSQEVFDLVREAVSYSSDTSDAFDLSIAPIMDLWGFTDSNYRVPTDAEIDAVLPLVAADRIVLDSNALTVYLPEPGMAIDLGGIAKGYTSDQVQREMQKYDITAGMLSLGGNVAVFGDKSDGTRWKVAIADPNNPTSYLGILTTDAISVITSGGYERYFEKDGKRYIHIMDPATGKPAESDLVSVTIITKDGVQGDALSTALFVMGREKAIAYYRSHGDFLFVLEDSDGVIYIPSALAGDFVASDTGKEIVTITAEGT